MKLSILCLGTCCVDKGRVLTSGVDEGKRVHTPIPGFLVQSDDGKVVLVDTGLHPIHVDDPDYTWRDDEFSAELTTVMRPEDAVAHRLQEVGLRVRDVTHIVNTHLHFDHCGNNRLFKGIPIYVQREQYLLAKDNPSFPAEYWDDPELDYQLLDGDVELFAGIECIVTPGHTPGHQSLVVHLKSEGPVLLCGDAIYCRENLDLDSWETQADPTLAKSSALRLSELNRKLGSMMIFGHDPIQWRDLRLAPLSYE